MISLDEIKSILYFRVDRYIRLRERSEKEIRDYLKRKIAKFKLPFSEDETVVQQITEKLKDEDLINDSRFISWWVNQRNDFKPRGKYLLQKELQNKGINQDLISHYFEDNVLNEDELALEVLRKKTRIFQSLPLLEMQQKAMNLLLRRGFGYSQSKKAFEEWRQNK